MQWIIIAALGGLILYLATRESEIQKIAKQIRTINPSIAPALATAQAATQVTDTALANAQGAEDKVGVLAAQTTAELEQTWGAALSTVEASLTSGRSALDAAEGAHNTALAEVQAIVEHINFVNSTGLTFPQVTLYGDANFGGRSQVFTPGDYPRLSGTTIGNDAASSLVVNKYFILEVYGDDNYGGKVQQFAALYDAMRVGDLRGTYIGNDTISSLRIWPDTKALSEALVGREATVTAVRAEFVSVKASVAVMVEQALRIAADIKILGILGARVAAVETTCTQLQARVAA